MQKVFNNQKKRMKMLQDMEEEHTHLFTNLQKSAQTILRLQNDNKAMKKALDKAQKDKEELVTDMKKRIAELDAELRKDSAAKNGLIELLEKEVVGNAIAIVTRDEFRGKLQRENIRLRERNGLNTQLVDPNREHRVSREFQAGGLDYYE
jgi:phage gp29-like protein